MLTQSLSGAVLFSVGDIAAQQLMERNGVNHDVRSVNT